MKPEQKNPLSKRAAAVEAVVTGEATGGEGRKPVTPADEVRATFIVDRRKLQLLKDHAYIERAQIKDIFDEMLSEYLSKHFDNSKAINGNTWDE